MPDWRDEQNPEHLRCGLKVAVVGPCASGKTTLVDALKVRGYDAHVVAQEHSIIRDLWRRRDPDVVIALDLDLDVVRQRRSPSWSAEIYAVQHERLRQAFGAADLLIDTGKHDFESALGMTIELLETRTAESP